MSKTLVHTMYCMNKFFIIIIIIICKDDHDRVTRLDPDYIDDKITRLSAGNERVSFVLTSLFHNTVLSKYIRTFQS